MLAGFTRFGRLGAQSGRSLESALRALFANGEQGAWYDPSDLSTLYADSAGTTPVAMPGQGSAVTVGLQLDKSRGLVLGSELVTNGDFSDDGAGWSVPANVTFSNNTAVFTSVANGSNLNRNCSTVAGRFYQITFTIVSISAGGFQPMVGGAVGATRTAPGTYTELVIAGAATGYTGVKVLSGVTTATIDNISVRELPGNHRFQTTAIDRPALSARYNLLTYTEDFSNGAWAKSSGVSVEYGFLAPDGTSTAWKITLPTGSGSQIYQVVAANAASLFESVWLRGENAQTLNYGFYDSSGDVSSISVTTSWAKYTKTRAAGLTTADRRANWIYGAVNNQVFYIWHPDLRAANEPAGLPPYQRVVDALTYDVVGFANGSAWDGAGDSSATNAGGGATTGIFYCASVRIDKVGAVQTLVSDTGTNTGFRVRINASNQLEFSVGNGSAYTTATTTPTVTLGKRHVLTCWHDGTNIKAQIDDTTVASEVSPTISAGTASVTFSKDNGAASNYFLGRTFATVYRHTTAMTDAQIAQVKRYVAAKGQVA